MRMNASDRKCFSHMDLAVYRVISGFSGYRNRFFGWKIDLHNGAGGTFGYTFPAQFALIKIDICQEIFNFYGLKSTYFYALVTPDARHLTRFARYSALICVHAAYIDAAPLWPFIPRFKQFFGASFHAGAAS